MTSRWNIAFDFDGVIHSDPHPSGGDIIPGIPVPGSLEKLVQCVQSSEIGIVYIWSMRCHGQHGIDAMVNWLHRYLQSDLKMTDDAAWEIIRHLHWTVVKQEHTIVIDDRCIQFKGDWNDPSLSIDALVNYQCWHRDWE